MPLPGGLQMEADGKMSIDIIAGIALVGLFFLLIALRIPIAFSLGLSALVAVFILDIEPAIIVQTMVKGVDTFSLLAVPLFIIAGELMGKGGISKRLIAFSKILVGNLKGGLGHVDILTGTFFGGISGSAVADISSVGSILIPMMIEDGFDREFSVGITLSSAVQAILIPPSHNMVIYALLAGVSVGQMFLAGFVPGLLLGVSLMIYTAYVARKRNYPTGKRVSLKEALRVSMEAIWGLGTIVIIVLGVVFGIFTVTESAAIAVVYSFFVSVFIYRETKLSDFFEIVRTAFGTVSMVMLMIACSAAFGWVLAYIRIPLMVSRSILGTFNNPVIIMLLINVILLVLGMICDMAPLILITTPVFLPIVTALGIDPVHFGIIMMLNLGIGLTTPPVGCALFVASSIGKLKMEETAKATLPMYGVMFIVLMIVTFVPQIVMFLPNLLG